MMSIRQHSPFYVATAVLSIALVGSQSGLPIFLHMGTKISEFKKTLICKNYILKRFNQTNNKIHNN